MLELFFIETKKKEFKFLHEDRTKKKSQTTIYTQVFSAMNSLNKLLKSFCFVSRLPDLPRVMLRMLIPFMKFIHCFC